MTDRSTRRRPSAETVLRDDRSLFVRLTHLVGRTLLRLMTRVKLYGLDGRSFPADGPLIVAVNHQSNADPPVIGSWVSPALGRNLHWLSKEEALSVPVVGWAMRQNGVFGIRRGAADIDAFRLARRVLDEGHVLVVFPEGTRSRTGGLQEAKDGLAILALRTGAPILPVAVWDTDRFWPRGRKIPRLGGSISMRVGEPFTPALITSRAGDRRAAQAGVTREIMGRIAALLPPERRGVYADLVPPD